VVTAGHVEEAQTLDMGLLEITRLNMAGQSDALALAQSILENKRREAEKLKRNRLVLEEDVSAGMLTGVS
jgi:hypothetical protein